MAYRQHSPTPSRRPGPEQQRSIACDAQLAYQLQLQLIGEEADWDSYTALCEGTFDETGTNTEAGYGPSDRQATLSPLTGEPRHTRDGVAVRQVRRREEVASRAAQPQPPLLLETPSRDGRRESQLNSSSRKRRMRTSTCLVCLGEVEISRAVCCKFDKVPAPLDPSVGGSSATDATRTGENGADCEHWLCRSCMREYLRSQMHEPKPQLRCCAPGCTAVVPVELAARLLGRGSKDLRKLLKTQAEAAIPNKVYCPNPACAAALEAPSELDEGLPFAHCPHCTRGMCVKCGVAWHDGLSCERYRSLPAELRGTADLTTLAFAKEKGLRCCPACREGIERQAGDCNYVRCRCGCSFCYACGVKYLSDVPTVANCHGVPGCQCSLFGAVEPHVDAAAVVQVRPVGRQPPQSPPLPVPMNLQGRAPAPQHQPPQAHVPYQGPRRLPVQYWELQPPQPAM